MDASSARALLQRKDGDASLYEHLTEVILHLLSSPPSAAGLQHFEAISAAVKAATFPALPAPTQGPTASGAAAEPVTQAMRAKLEGYAKLYKPRVADDEAGGEEAPAPGEPVQDLMEEANYLQWAGVSLGGSATFLLHLSLKQCASKFPVRNLRWWGKLLGKDADYLVAEGSMDAEDEEPEDAKDALGNVIEKTGVGANKHTYFVCNEVGGEWVKLPPVTPHQIIVARKLRRFFTGKLDAPVSGHPPFPGTERNLVRATISLISAATVLGLSGAFVPVEGDEDGAIQPNEEEWDAPDLSSLDAWVHMCLDLNALGRTKPNPPKMDEEGNEITDPDAPEPSVPLRGAGEDAPVDEALEEGGGAWDIRSLPVTGVPEGESTGLVVLRSLLYPGAFAVGFQKKRCANVYIGYGHPVALKPYQPALPPALPAEYDFAAEGNALKEAADVLEDPNAGKEAEGEGEEEE